MRGSRAQVAAGCILYGSRVMLVYTTGHGVAGFTYEPSLKDLHQRGPLFVGSSELVREL